MPSFKSYHGTNKKCTEKIIKDGFKINIPIVSIESSSKKGKCPGNFGYGFYTFLEDEKLAQDFSIRMNSAETYSVIQIDSCISSDELLSMLNDSDRSNYHAYRETAYQTGFNHLKKFGVKVDSKVQHVLEGIIIELFIMHLSRKEGIKVVAVLGDSYTPTSEGMFSWIPNGTELCIRDKNVINSLKR